eukprot:TRINITY_DN5023_c0_g1_i1.p1 TRINITY_DN5023_c0_g1~~TRINITY_DN5023_c0_g1_i1.p1  ORF type:complete len:304 (-),score=124.99 TRINITY_DN5023_c0_g1_i1:43-954(-)
MFEIIGYILLALILIPCIFGLIAPLLRSPKSIKNKNVLITGAGMGIGKEMAFEFASKGANIILVDINKENVDQAAKEVKEKYHKIQTWSFQCDVSNSVKVYEVAKEILQICERVDILVNNAGVVGGKFLLDSPDSLLRRTLEINTLAHFWTVKAFLPGMIERNSGHIVTIASIMGYIPAAGLVDYCCSKYGALGFAESIEIELRRLGKSGIKTTVVCPYAINTGMFSGLSVNLQWLVPTLKPKDVAEAIVDAVRRDKLQLLIPKVLHLTLLISQVVPVSVRNFILYLFGAYSGMDNFKGRSNN